MNHCWKYYASTQLAMTVFKFQDLLNSRCFRVYQYLSINDQKKKKEKKRKETNKMIFVSRLYPDIGKLSAGWILQTYFQLNCFYKISMDQVKISLSVIGSTESS